MNSIHKKFTFLILICICISTCCIGFMAYWYISHFQTEDSDRIMSMTCRQEADSLNRQFTGIHDAINIYADRSLKRLPSADSLRDEAFLTAYVGEMEDFMSDIARNMDYIGAYYMRLAPGITADDNKAGFYYSRRENRKSLSKEPLPEVTRYDRFELESVGWFYQPKAAAMPVWLKPYHNKNVNAHMISYVIPLYKNEKFIGVCGMDVDFDAIIDDISGINPYRTGATALFSGKGEVYYHPEFAPGTLLTDYSPDLQAVIDDMQFSISENQKTNYTYKVKGAEKKLSFSHLKNGMVLALSAETKEINAPQRMLMRGIALIMVTLALLAVVITYFISRRITRPLQVLTEAADEIAAGNLDVTLPEPGNDEVGILARSFGIAVERQRDFIAGIQNEAFKDPLTHVKNKAAYEVEKERLARDMRMGAARFALLMVDINDLKKMNDSYGHEHGDLYLMNCSEAICRVFRHSPVYRIGGDEFLVLLENSDYNHRDERIGELVRCIKENQIEKEAWKRISFAWGLGIYQPSDELPDDVFHRADQAMYAHKRSMKVGR